VPLDSLSEEFAIPGRNWRGKTLDEKTFSFCYLFIQHIKTARSWFKWGCLQYVRTSSFNCSDWRHKSMFGS